MKQIPTYITLKTYIIFLLLCLAPHGFAQILSNGEVNPHIAGSSVIFDASTAYSAEAGAPNNVGKGVLIPSVDLVNFEFIMNLADGSTFPTYFDGMLVYNRATGNTLTTGNRSSTVTAVKPGFYYYFNPNGANNGSVTGGSWKPMNDNSPNASSGGTSVISSFDCAGSTPGGNLTGGVSISGVTQTIPVTVAESGTYDITTTSTNGIIFRGTGTLAAGAQNVILFAYGTPTAGGSFNFALTTTPGCSFTRTVADGSSGGTAVISSFDCAGSTANGGNMTVGLAPTGISQTIPVTVTTAGTYNITTTASNGVTFSGSGTLAVGAQTITLNASGIPSASGSPTFTLTTTPGCGFARTINDPSSNGTAVMSYVSCSQAANGTMTALTPVSGVSQTIRVNVTTAGTWSITTPTVNGVYFTGSGSVGTGTQDIVLNAVGTPAAAGTGFSYATNTTPSCSFNRDVVGSNPSATFTCGAITSTQSPTGSLIPGQAYTGTVTIPYTGGNGSAYGTTTLGPIYGLTLTRVAGTSNPGGGNIIYNLTGNYNGPANGSVTFTGFSECPGNIAFFGDAIRSAIIAGGSTSLAAYDAAPVNGWVKITEAEYNAIASTANIAGVGKTSVSDALMNVSTVYNFGTDVTTGPTNGLNVSGNYTAIPASSYVIAFKTRFGTPSPATITNVQPKIQLSSSLDAGPYTAYGGVVGAFSVTNGGFGYWTIKRPNVATYSGGISHFAVYGGSSTNYDGWIGFTLDDPNSAYSHGNGNNATLGYGGSGTVQIQTLTTKIKQW